MNFIAAAYKKYFIGKRIIWQVKIRTNRPIPLHCGVPISTKRLNKNWGEI